MNKDEDNDAEGKVTQDRYLEFKLATVIRDELKKIFLQNLLLIKKILIYLDQYKITYLKILKLVMIFL